MLVNTCHCISAVAWVTEYENGTTDAIDFTHARTFIRLLVAVVWPV